MTPHIKPSSKLIIRIHTYIWLVKLSSCEIEEKHGPQRMKIPLGIQNILDVMFLFFLDSPPPLNYQEPLSTKTIDTDNKIPMS